MQKSLSSHKEKTDESVSNGKQDWSDPSGKIYVADFADADEEKAWVEYAQSKEKRAAA